MSFLFCAFCMHLPPRSDLTIDQRLEAAEAWTFLNGYAVCNRHVEFAMGAATSWEERLAAAAQREQDVLRS